MTDRDHYRRVHGFGGLAMVSLSPEELERRHAADHTKHRDDLDHYHAIVRTCDESRCVNPQHLLIEAIQVEEEQT